LAGMKMFHVLTVKVTILNILCPGVPLKVKEGLLLQQDRQDVPHVQVQIAVPVIKKNGARS